MNLKSRLTLLVLAAASLLALTGCGGGSTEARIGGGGTGAPLAVAVGPVTGFGSIIVNGEAYDETGAEIVVDTRPDQPTPSTVAAVRLGMQVELQHRERVVSKATISSELIGPVSSVSVSSFVALAQTVLVNADPARPTVFEGLSALTDLAAGSVVEVHGDRNGAGDIVATRVELKPNGFSVVRIAGTAAGVLASGFAIGDLLIDATGATIVPAGGVISGGQRVVVWTDVPYTGGVLGVKVVRVGTTALVNNTMVSADGVIAEFQSVSSFKVAGFTINASAARITGGNVSNLQNGRAVRVRGTFGGNVLNASSIELLPAQQTQLTGAITDFVDAVSAFRIRDALARVTAQTTYVGGTAANLGTGVMVKLAGTVVNGVVEAQTVEFLPVTAGSQRVVFGTIAAPVSPVAGDGSRTFRIDALTVDVKTTAATTYKHGTAADVAVGREVKLKGELQGTQYVADEVQFMDDPGNPPTFEIKGIASNVQPTSVDVNGQSIRLEAGTSYTLNGVTATLADLKNGLEVEIVAVRVTGKLTARTVEIKSAGSGAASIRGIVSGRTPPDAARFLVGSQTVDVSGNPQIIPGNKTLADIVNGSDIEVDGTIAAGVLNATRIKIRG
jgi:hypothetical protein